MSVAWANAAHAWTMPYTPIIPENWLKPFGTATFCPSANMSLPLHMTDRGVSDRLHISACRSLPAALRINSHHTIPEQEIGAFITKLVTRLDKV
ncbi:MAG: hypothetical protein K6T83_01700 [Alicyclobacillus sp.]|nr:hypothetical protein [Alicyclobacillus sp.]